jgi:hypothetical protein
MHWPGTRPQHRYGPGVRVVAFLLDRLPIFVRQARVRGTARIHLQEIPGSGAEKSEVSSPATLQQSQPGREAVLSHRRRCDKMAFSGTQPAHWACLCSDRPSERGGRVRLMSGTFQVLSDVSCYCGEAWRRLGGECSAARSTRCGRIHSSLCSVMDQHEPDRQARRSEYGRKRDEDQVTCRTCCARYAIGQLWAAHGNADCSCAGAHVYSRADSNCTARAADRYPCANLDANRSHSRTNAYGRTDAGTGSHL